MKQQLGKTIQQMRKVQGCTQEQMAETLGVSVAAVSKWENGVSCPDITLLPALARYLKTDLNALLSFHEKISEQEAAAVVNEMSEIFFRSGFEAAYEFIMGKIREYPGSDILLLNGAMALSGALAMGKDPEEAQLYKDRIEQLYERAARSEDTAVRDQARYMLASGCMARGEYGRAEELLDGLPEEQTFDKRQMQVNLCLARNELTKAAQIEERKLMQTAVSLSMVFSVLIEIAVREGREEDARYLAEAAGKAAEALDMWEYTAGIPWLELYVHRKDRDNCLEILEKMLTSAAGQWDHTSSPLYRHVKKKEGEDRLGARMRETLISAVESDEQYAFLHNTEAWERIKTAGYGADRSSKADET